MSSPVGLSRSDLFKCVMSRNGRQFNDLCRLLICQGKGFLMLLNQMLKRISHPTPPETATYFAKRFTFNYVLYLESIIKYPLTVVVNQS